MESFSDLFQTKIACDGATVFTLDELTQASERSSLSQIPLVQTRVGKLVKSIIKDKQLFQLPVVAYIAPEGDEEPEYYLVSGRHRIAAISLIVGEYGQTAKGSWVQVSQPEQRASGALTFVEGLVEVLRLECSDKKTLGELVLTYNGSRSMTAAESALTHIESGKATKKGKFQAALATDLHVSVPVLTYQTCFTVASKLIGIKRLNKTTNEHIHTGLPHLGQASDDAVASVVAQFASWFTLATNAGTLPSNLSREVASVAAQFFSWLESTLTDDQTESRFDYLVALLKADIEKPETTKGKGKGSKVSDLTIQLQEAQRLIAELGAQQNL